MATRAHPAHKRAEARKGSTPALEWLLGGLGAALLVAGVAFLIYEGLTANGAPGRIEVRLIDVTPAGDAFVVRYELHNAGDDTLSNLRVTARITEGGEEVERATVVFDYLPSRSSQKGGFYLQHDPRRYTLEITPEGYQEP